LSVETQSELEIFIYIETQDSSIQH